MCNDRDKTYSKLADFGIINAQDLRFLRGTKAETGNKVEEEQDDARSEKRVGKARDTISKLVCELDIIMVDPSAVRRVDSVEVDNVVTLILMLAGHSDGQVCIQGGRLTRQRGRSADRQQYHQYHG